ncbi:MAG: peptidylprolyl isomerase [Tissierellia bacterium]|nr:peptidylprolyl isomerase [Tissierellia bacterium]
MKKKVYALVDDVEITSDDVLIFVESLAPEVKNYFLQNPDKTPLINELIQQQLLYFDAIEKGYDQEEDFIRVAEKARQSMLKTYALGKLLQGIEVSDEEVEAFYEDHKEDFKEQKKVSAAHILVESEDVAKEISEKLKSGERFEELAKMHSTCPSSQKGGNLGTFAPGQMVPEFDQVVFEMEKGEISQPVKTQFGYHIIKVDDIQKERNLSFDEVKENIADQIRRQKEQVIYQDKIDELKKEHEIKWLNED